jgi:hypothetical protein
MLLPETAHYTELDAYWDDDDDGDDDDDDDDAWGQVRLSPFPLLPDIGILDQHWIIRMMADGYGASVKW